MIKKFFIAILASMSVLAIGCGTDNNGTKEVNNTVGEVQELKIASGTVAATQVMDKLEMELVGVPQTSTELPKDMRANANRTSIFT